MRKHIERLRGMQDILPEVQQQQQWLIDRLATFLGQAGYRLVESPILEQSDLFLASFGQELWQDLYAFRLHHRDLCLRPEYTASICRLYLDHYRQHPLPLRFQYAGPIFRNEAPSRDRYRQHTQLGIELLGGHAAAADAEILQLACDILRELHIPQYRVELGHIGVASGFINRLNLDDHAAHLLLSLMEQIHQSEEGERRAQAHLESLYPIGSAQEGDDRRDGGQGSQIDARSITSLLSGVSIAFGDDATRHEMIERFLWKMGRSEQRRQIFQALEFLRALHAIAGSPPTVFDALRDLLGHYGLDPEPLAELELLVSVVEQCGVPAQHIMLNLSLGRGVQYYTGLVFEIHAQGQDGFDTQLCGGGRYDRLIQAIGDTGDVNACGFSFGVERLLSHLPQHDLPELAASHALVIPMREQNLVHAMQVARTVRASGIRTEVDVAMQGVDAGLRVATRMQIRCALIVGENEQHNNTVILRDLVLGDERVVALDMVGEAIASYI